MPLDSRVKKKVLELIGDEASKAVEKGEFEYAGKLRDVMRLVDREATKIRRENPYNVFMKKCLVDMNGTPQEKMKTCGEKWSSLSDTEKEEYDTEELIAVDYQ